MSAGARTFEISPPIEPAAAEDFEAIRELLAQCRLPTADLERSRPWLVVARSGREIFAVGGVEMFASTGLLRSIAVHPRLRGTGLGRALVDHLEHKAREAGISELVLLTETAKPFFEKLGYRVIERASAPPAILVSEEFRSICPQSASCLSKQLTSRSEAPTVG